MKKYNYLFWLLTMAIPITIVCCNNVGENRIIDVKDNTIEKDSDGVKSKAHTEDFLMEDTTELQNIYNTYINHYYDTIRIDTTVIRHDSIIKIDFCHYCLFDSALTVPEKYIEFYKIGSFVTHNLVSTLKVKIGNTNVLDTLITKQMFNERLPDHLRNYGILVYSDFQLDSLGFIKIQYNMVIPLTDLGEFITYTYKL